MAKKTESEERKIATTNLNIYSKLQKVQSEIKELTRTEENKFQKYWYFDELQVLRHLKPLLTKYQLTLLLSDDETKDFLCEPHGNMWLVKYGKKCELIASDNPSEKLIYYFWASALNQDPAKAKGSAETYAVKYFLSKLFLIPVKDEGDPDSFELKEKPSEIVNKTYSTKLDLTNPVQATITDIKNKLDKNSSKYLLLETDILPNNVFVFDYKVEAIRWSQLIKNKTYQFSLEESPNGLLTLLDFKEIC